MQGSISENVSWKGCCVVKRVVSEFCIENVTSDIRQVLEQLANKTEAVVLMLAKIIILSTGNTLNV